MTIRYDRFEVSASKTPEGFIQDSPVIGRVGILTYINQDGSVRRELRPPEEAFSEDSLATLRGKPVTSGHPGLVRSDNVAAVKPIGTVLTPGRQDGDNIRADLVIYNLDTSARELSCGYSLDLEETPGEWQGQRYDAIQRKIRYNHVAVVPKGRAGPAARLNMDGDQLIEDEEENNDMPKIRLDNGLEYEASQEVIVAFNAIKNDNASLQVKLDTAEAKVDTLQAANTKLDEQLKNKDKEHADNLGEAVKQRVSLLSVAAAHKLDTADTMSNRQIKEAVIKAVRGDGMDLAQKSDEYVNAAFDMVKEDARGSNMAQQRRAAGATPPASGGERNDEFVTSDGARQRMIERQQKAYQGGKE